MNFEVNNNTLKTVKSVAFQGEATKSVAVKTKPIENDSFENTDKKSINKTGKVIGWIATIGAITAGSVAIAKNWSKIQETLGDLVYTTKNKINKSHIEKESAKNLKNATEMRKKIYNVPGVKEITDRMSKHIVINQDVELFEEATSVFESVKGNADIVNCLKKDSKNKDLLDFFKNKDAFTQSFLLLGEDEKAKQKLIDFYVKQAKESDIAIENFKYILDKTKTGYGSDNIHDFVELTEKCIERFEKENKMSLIVIDNAEEFLKEENVGSAMGTWNILSQNFNKQGISAIATAKNLEELNESAVRDGRLDYWIDIDKMAKDVNKKL